MRLTLWIELYCLLDRELFEIRSCFLEPNFILNNFKLNEIENDIEDSMMAGDKINKSWDDTKRSGVCFIGSQNH